MPDEAIAEQAVVGLPELAIGVTTEPRRRSGIIGEPPQFREAAYELSRRGFDVVVFGHTHHPGEVELENGKRYLNPGSWLLSCHYVEIQNGEVILKTWEC